MVEAQGLSDRTERVLAFINSRKRPVSTKMIAERFLITPSAAAAYLRMLSAKDLIRLTHTKDSKTGRLLKAGRRK